jgi:hypothetical protein
MKLFVSYARVDKPYCVQIVDTLDIHEIWVDQRLAAGQNWWKEILRRLDWCEGFIYLLSPDSVNSEYCRREFELARSLGRPIFPILIREGTVIPQSLKEIQYVDFTRGIVMESLKMLLNSIQLEERAPAKRHAAQNRPQYTGGGNSSADHQPGNGDPSGGNGDGKPPVRSGGVLSSASQSHRLLIALHQH